MTGVPVIFYTKLFLLTLLLTSICSCKSRSGLPPANTISDDVFYQNIDSFADTRIIKYQCPAFDRLTPNQRLLAYYLVQAGLSGRDIIYDQNYQFNLVLTRVLEKIYLNHKGNKDTKDWKNYERYLKQIWVSNGIHDAFTGVKIQPLFTKEYFTNLMSESHESLSPELVSIMFDPRKDALLCNNDPAADQIRTSAVNFYNHELTEADIEVYYRNNEHKNKNGKLTLSTDGFVKEIFWKTGGMYAGAIRQIIYWLEKAAAIAENKQQEHSFRLLIEYFKTADPGVLEKYEKARAAIDNNKIDFQIGFNDISHDPLKLKAGFVTLVYIKDDISARQIKMLRDSIQFFKDFAALALPAQDLQTKGVDNSFELLSAGGSYAPAWRKNQLPNYFTNINKAIVYTESKSLAREFAPSPEIYSGLVKYTAEASKFFQWIRNIFLPDNQNISTKPEWENLNIIDYAKADLQALYMIFDPMIFKRRLLGDEQAARTMYDHYITKSLLVQLHDTEPGKNITNPELRAKQLVATMAFEKGQSKNIIVKEKINGKTYFRINNYKGLRQIFGQLLKDLNNISDDNGALRSILVEKYGTTADQQLMAEVNARINSIGFSFHPAFIQPVFEPIKNANGQIVDVQILYPDNFNSQMLFFSEKYRLLPNSN
ncbi:MAG TPA: hypothetical protein PKN57_01475 [Saprospiraceae bacterium]|nr:hypothetical protein [Saprospiraceae bacterium]MCC6688113.1 hypothetical protein [Saprospiraceae bacterium]HMX81869.1 hypothetical protein [Saprospiraceae bacterium]HMX84325.1 hypothetical protein [Saprospiraceae bacterium]HMZ72320.1 hypothetical protein [Saprospiraceae bacterium]